MNPRKFSPATLETSDCAVDLSRRPRSMSTCSPVARLCHVQDFRPKHAARRTARRRGKTPLRVRGHSAGRSVTWPDSALQALSRLSRESRRSQGSLPQHVFGPCTRTESDKVVVAVCSIFLTDGRRPDVLEALRVPALRGSKQSEGRNPAPCTCIPPYVDYARHKHVSFQVGG